MTFTKIAVGGFAALLGFVCWLAASGFGAAREGVIALVALVVLVGGGNLLAGRDGPHGRRGASPAPDRGGPQPGQEADAARSDEPAP